MIGSSSLISVHEAAALITAGAPLLIAGDAELLARLPSGQWIGGSIPYFMSTKGGLLSKDQVFVTRLPKQLQLRGIRRYGPEELAPLFSDAPAHGLSFLLIPGNSPSHLRFALEAPNLAGFGVQPAVGWVAGVDVAELGQKAPLVFDGRSVEVLADAVLVMDFELSSEWVADVEIINIFEPTDAPIIRFLETGFEVKRALIDGEELGFAEYLRTHEIDLSRPLIADCSGALVNTSFKAIAGEQVQFYAPVFADVDYRLAKPLENYAQSFAQQLEAQEGEPVFACNCILNYLYGGLEGKQTAGFLGPFTFGEIAYQLLNQTLVSVELRPAALG
ncbi:MAG: hypothetical protein RBU37_09995 [Myxococcota bacterium]|jgi:hypothetical protein|nr:hypothetical protein [Myxococcota bacterium]